MPFSLAIWLRHVQFLEANPNRIQADIDRRTLADLRNRLDRDLTSTERSEHLQAFAAALRTRTLAHLRLKSHWSVARPAQTRWEQ
ncbi:MAG: hypothetical protein OXH76_09470 [Boseongicola sp.]|nr:hypothetical protein [Boseongicola sp.]